MEPCKVTQADAITIPQLKREVRSAWKERPYMRHLSVILLRDLPEKTQVSSRTVSKPEGLPEEYERIASDMAEGYHAAALEMEIPSEDARGYRVLPPYDEHSHGLHKFLQNLHNQLNEGDYVVGEFGGRKVSEKKNR